MNCIKTEKVYIYFVWSCSIAIVFIDVKVTPIFSKCIINHHIKLHNNYVINDFWMRYNIKCNNLVLLLVSTYILFAWILLVVIFVISIDTHALCVYFTVPCTEPETFFSIMLISCCCISLSFTDWLTSLSPCPHWWSLAYYNLSPFPFCKKESKVDLKWGLATGGACFTQHVAVTLRMRAPITSTMKAPSIMRR